MLVLGWEQLGEVPRAVQTDLDLVTSAFSKSYYNNRQFLVESHPCNGGTFESLIITVEQWQDDANDITYIYQCTRSVGRRRSHSRVFCGDGEGIRMD